MTRHVLAGEVWRVEDCCGGVWCGKLRLAWFVWALIGMVWCVVVWYGRHGELSCGKSRYGLVRYGRARQAKSRKVYKWQYTNGRLEVG